MQFEFQLSLSRFKMANGVKMRPGVPISSWAKYFNRCGTVRSASVQPGQSQKGLGSICPHCKLWFCILPNKVKPC